LQIFYLGAGSVSRGDDSAPCQWRNISGDAKRTAYAPHGCAPAFGTLKLKWTSEVLKATRGTTLFPVVFDDRLFATDDTELVCLDVETGKRIWSTDVLVFEPFYISCDGEGLYTIESDKGKHALTKRKMTDGSLVWKRTLSQNNVGEPVVANGRVYLAYNDIVKSTGKGTSYVTCFEASSGKPLWQTQIANWRNQLAVCGEYLLTTATKTKLNDDKLITHHGDLYCIDAITGSQKWMIKPDKWGQGFLDYPIVDDEFVYIGIYNEDHNSPVLCLSLETGEEVWSVYHPSRYVYPIAKSHDRLISQAAGRGLTCTTLDGKESCMDVYSPGLYESSIVVSDDLGFGYTVSSDISRHEHKIFTISFQTQKEIWEHEEEFKITGIAVSGGCFFVANTRGIIYCYESMEQPPRPDSITVGPRNAKVYPGDFVQFSATVYDQYGKIIDTEVEWLTYGDDIGEVTSDGVLNVGGNIDNIGKVCAKITDDVIGCTYVTVLDPIEMTTKELGFRVTPWMTDTKEIVLKNRSSHDIELGIKSFNKWLTVSESVTLVPGENRVEASVSSDSMSESDFEDGYIWLSYPGNSLELYVYAELVPWSGPCVSYKPEMGLQFSDIDRVGTQSQSFTLVNNTGLEVELELAVSGGKEWLSVEPEHIVFDGRETQVTVTVDEDYLPEDTRVVGYISVGPLSDCERPPDFPVVVQAPEIKVINLWIGEQTARVDGDDVLLDCPPQIISGRTFVPLRFVSEALGFDIGWNGADRSIAIKAGDDELVIWVNKTTYLKNGEEFAMDAPPVIVNGRTLVPIRLIGEAFGAKVEWDGSERMVTIKLANR